MLQLSPRMLALLLPLATALTNLRLVLRRRRHTSHAESPTDAKDGRRRPPDFKPRAARRLQTNVTCRRLQCTRSDWRRVTAARSA